MNNCTIYNNSSPAAGGGFNLEGGCWLSVTNSIIWANSQPVLKLRSWGEDPTLQAKLQMSFTDIGPGSDVISTDELSIVEMDKSIFNRDPKFTNYCIPDLFLLQVSPCIDSGDPNGDLDPDGTVADLGAIYFPQPNLQLSTRWISWPEIHPHQTQRYTVDVRNIGVLPLFVRSIEFNSDDAFRLESESPLANFFIEPGSVERYRIVFSPLDYREHRGLLAINSDDRSEPRALVFIQGFALLVSDESASVSGEFQLLSAYPNPFNAELKVEFYLLVPGPVRVDLLDPFGRQAAIPNTFPGRAGLNMLALSGEKLPGGTYFLRLSQGQHRAVSRVLLLK